MARLEPMTGTGRGEAVDRLPFYHRANNNQITFGQESLINPTLYFGKNLEWQQTPHTRAPAGQWSQTSNPVAVSWQA